MRISLLFLAASFVTAPQLAVAQDQPPPATVDDYVCQFSGECTEDVPDPNAPRISATRGFALSGAGTTSSRPRGTARVAGAAQRTVRRPVGPGQRVNLRLAFETGSATLTGAARAQAQIFAQSLQRPQLASLRFQIEGHTDSVGSRQSNVALSQRRAQSVADFLANAGVSRERLVVRGYGPDRPIPGTRASAGENRRVEAVRIN
ncbi:MAG TPA: OmpA family protein [Allosphingosinicella sp.]|nr:OmpA family protein [Allosphingosinicella sp.]